VRCSRPEAFMAPRTVPTTAQQIPTKAIMTMNHLMETVWDTETPQQDLASSSVTKVWPGACSCSWFRDRLENPGIDALQPRGGGGGGILVGEPVGGNTPP